MGGPAPQRCMHCIQSSLSLADGTAGSMCADQSGFHSSLTGVGDKVVRDAGAWPVPSPSTVHMEGSLVGSPPSGIGCRGASSLVVTVDSISVCATAAPQRNGAVLAKKGSGDTQGKGCGRHNSSGHGQPWFWLCAAGGCG